MSLRSDRVTLSFNHLVYEEKGYQGMCKLQSNMEAQDQMGSNKWAMLLIQFLVVMLMTCIVFFPVHGMAFTKLGTGRSHRHSCCPISYHHFIHCTVNCTHARRVHPCTVHYRFHSSFHCVRWHLSTVHRGASMMVM